MQPDETMTIPRPLRKLASLQYAVAFGLALAACSGGSEQADRPPGSPGSAGSAGSAGSGTGPNVGGSSASSAEVIGVFQVGIEAATSEVQVLGKVSDAPLPPNVIWEVAHEDGDCRVLTPGVPFCDPACGANICQPGNTCLPYPVGQGVGEVTLSGVQLMSGERELILKEVVKNYQPPPGTVFAFPPFAEGDEVRVHAAGGDYPGFDLVTAAVAPLSLTSNDFALEEGKDLELTWDAAGAGASTQIHLKLDISHHGGTKGMIECRTADAGSLSVPGALLTELIGLGVAGFPTLELTRVSTASVGIGRGRVELKVSAFAGQAVTIAGFDSCTATTCEDPNDTDCVPCPNGLECQSDLTCK
ncbi:MAG TPA: hypothetical protein VJN18_19060 [Polyangiaceae bacterium]|nr:hypothetical protein [Polyangiaceae bacterium]